MPIDFHDPATRTTYAQRLADNSWSDTIAGLVDPRGARVADIGCGGGIYSTAWLDLGAASVVGVDFSEQMILAAQNRAENRAGLSFVTGDATDTGLPTGSYDVVFQKALIHHLPEPAKAFAEARRLLAPGGTLIVQDRTMDDVRKPGSAEHLRGYFFEVFPKLLAVEERRRPEAETVTSALHSLGFAEVATSTLAEKRQSYSDVESLRQDLAARTGRSILHDLSDTELETLIDVISANVSGLVHIDEIDYWTVWTATTTTAQ